MTLSEAPVLHLAFASLHLLVGHFGAAAVHWIRFRRSPLVLYRRGASPHQRITRAVSVASLAWAAALIASATSSAFRASLPGRALFVVFTLRRRGTDTLIRAISARYMHRKEADHYAKTCKT